MCGKEGLVRVVAVMTTVMICAYLHVRFRFGFEHYFMSASIVLLDFSSRPNKPFGNACVETTRRAMCC